MKKLFLIALCLHGFVFGQEFNLEWAGTYRGPEQTQALGVSTDNNGNVYTTGFFRGTVDFDPGSGEYNLTSYGSENIFITKVDANGNFVWAKHLGSLGYGYSSGNAITVDNQGFLYITGQFSFTVDFDPGPAEHLLLTNGLFDCFILKLDTDGNFVWVKNLGGSQNDYGYGIDVDLLGNIVVVGLFEENADFDPGSGVFNLISAGSHDVFITKLDNNGDFIWAKSFGNSDWDRVNDVEVDYLGNVYIVGEFRNTVDFDPGLGVYNLTTINRNGYILKLDPTGSFSSVRKLVDTLATGHQSIAVSIVTDSNGNVYVSGYFFGTINLDPIDLTVFVAGNTNVFVAKWNSEGDLLWGKQFGGTANVENSGIALDNSGNVYSTGLFQGTIDFDPSSGINNLTATGGYNIYLSKLDANGNFIAAGRIGGTNGNFSKGLSVDNSGMAHVVGYYFGNTDFDPGLGTYNIISVGSAATTDAFTAKYSVSSCTVTGIDVQTACGSYTWIDGVTYNTSNNIATHTIVGGGANGCDSIVTLNLTINQLTSSSVSATACGNYTWALNNQTYTTSGTYTHVIQNSNNCDSTITLNLTINDATSSTVNTSACGSYTWVLNNQTYTTSGTYTHVIQNANNCDSTITLNLTINQATSSSVNASACGSYTWMLNNQTYTTSGVYTHVIQNSNNCDSTITLNLTINEATSSSVNVSACGSYTWSLNNQTYTTSGAYIHVIQNSNNCDSTITLNLTINQATSSAVNVSACGSYTWLLNNQTYTSSGAYTHVIPNANNCDSTITLNLTINQVDATVSLEGITLTANQSGASYQWVDCDNGNAPISGETSQSFTPTVNGNYAVQITDNGCTEVSNCVLVNSVGIKTLENITIDIYPNPNNGIFTVSISQNLKDRAVEIYSPLGQLVYKTLLIEKEEKIDLSNYPNGVYILKMDKQTTRIIKTN